ncbi:MAG TPA: biotin transporter BioY [Acidobacteriaceae bacterium]|nr:biotin transporter BioY [Acidobacteriaceae bacterium]
MNRNAGVVAAERGELNEAPGLVVNLLRGAGIVLAGSALIAVCAHIAIPLWFTPVPITLQPFAVLLLGLLLNPRLAFGAALAYLAEGAAGLPVFTPHGLGGAAQLLGLTGGYLLSYPLVAPMVSWLWRRGSRSFTRGLAIAGLGSLVTLALGAIWLGMETHAAPSTVLNHAVLPFLPGDLLKICAAAGIATGVSRLRRQNG